jgi:hypothetical protein
MSAVQDQMFKIFTSLYLLKGEDRRDEDLDDVIELESEIPEALSTQQSILAFRLAAVLV